MSNPIKGHNGTIRVVKCCDMDASNVLCASAGAGDFKPRLWNIQTGAQFELNNYIMQRKYIISFVTIHVHYL